MSKQNLLELAAERLNAAQEGSRNASKYDFVKVRVLLVSCRVSQRTYAPDRTRYCAQVKVWLGADMAHYYVLSR